MFILRDLLLPLQHDFSDSNLGRRRARYFLYTLLAIAVPFTSSITSNLLRSLNNLFGLTLPSSCYYTFMGTKTLPWKKLWSRLWASIQDPLTDGRLVVALDDFINVKTGKKIFGCSHVHDHAAKANQCDYPWAQCVVKLGLLKQIKGRWACIPLSALFYFRQKDLDADIDNTKVRGVQSVFRNKLMQGADMVREVAAQFGLPVLIVCDSWFGNDGLWKALDRGESFDVHVLSRLRSNSALYALPVKPSATARGRRRKYGERAGQVRDLAATLRESAQSLEVDIYGKRREVQCVERMMMIKTMKCQVRVVWVFRRSHYVALFTTDLTLSVAQIIEYYAARWKIESGFKEIKQEIGSARSQTRDAHAVQNHLQFCLMATTLVWVYAQRLSNTPHRRHEGQRRAGFAFSDVRRLLAKEALDKDFQRICLKRGKQANNSFVELFMRLVA